jgi:glycerol-3-phosphate acyltransferase PlsX
MPALRALQGQGRRRRRGSLSARAPRVAVDAIGGDHGLGVVVEGAQRASRRQGVVVSLVGPERQLREAIAQAAQAAPGEAPLEVVDAPESVGMGEKLSLATLKKRSSIQVALERVRDGQADAFFSAGNTAACWAIARRVLGTLEEVDRPALAAVVPTRHGRSVLIDVGANAECTARQLEEFAIMGSAYARGVLGIARPRVGLMSVGEEETKGNELVREAHEVLKRSSLNFVGNVEGHDLFSGKADVVVMDGFTGNVVLKASETAAELVFELLRDAIGAGLRGRLGALLLRPAFAAVKRRSDPAQVGGAPLIGLRGCCVIGHGKSSALAIEAGIRTAASFHASGVNAAIEAEIKALLRSDAEAPGHQPQPRQGARA